MPYAALVPLDRQMATERGGLLALKGTGHGLWGEDVAGAIDRLRDEWA